MAAICRMAWLFWPVSLAVLNRIGRYLLYEVAVLARIAGRYLLYQVAVLARIGGRDDPYWPLFAVWRGWPGPYRWPL